MLMVWDADGALFYGFDNNTLTALKLARTRFRESPVRAVCGTYVRKTIIGE